MHKLIHTAHIQESSQTNIDVSLLPSESVVEGGGEYHKRMARREAFTAWLTEVLSDNLEEDAGKRMAQKVSFPLLL